MCYRKFSDFFGGRCTSTSALPTSGLHLAPAVEPESNATGTKHQMDLSALSIPKEPELDAG